MQNVSNDQINYDCAYRSAMNWIANLLHQISQELAVNIVNSHWKIDSAGDDSNYQFIVIGPRDRRVIKLFSSLELKHCLEDTALQAEIRGRLTQLVMFVGAKGNQDSSKKLARRHKQQ